MQNPGHLPPALPPTHYLDNRIFTDPSIFREEQERLFSKVWQFVCHESELPNSGDFRSAPTTFPTLGGLRCANANRNRFCR